MRTITKQKQKATQIVKINIGEVKKRPATRRRRRQTVQKKQKEDELKRVAESKPFYGVGGGSIGNAIANTEQLNRTADFTRRFESLENRLQLDALRQEQRMRDMLEQQRQLFQQNQPPQPQLFQPIAQPANADLFQPLDVQPQEGEEETVITEASAGSLPDTFGEPILEQEEPTALGPPEPEAEDADGKGPEDEEPAQAAGAPYIIRKAEQLNTAVEDGELDAALDFIKKYLSYSSFVRNTTALTRNVLAGYIGVAQGRPQILFDAIKA